MPKDVKITLPLLPLTSKEILATHALANVQSDLVSLLQEEWDDAFAAYLKAYTAWLEDNPDTDPNSFKFRIGMCLVLRPCAGDLATKATLNYGIKHKAETMERISSAQPQIPEQPAPGPTPLEEKKNKPSKEKKS